MKGYSRSLLAVVVCLASGVPTLAKAQLGMRAGCPVENAQVSVSFNGMDTGVSVVRAKLDAKIAEVKALAKEQEFTKLVLQSYNYNINANNFGGNGGELRYQYNGSISFAILPPEKAVDFMQMLSKKGYQANVSVSSYNNGNCAQTLER